MPLEPLQLYRALVLRHPLRSSLVLLSLVAFSFVGLRNFRMEATSDSIVLENDSDLRFYDETRMIFGSDAELIVALQPDDTAPEDGLLTRKTLDRIAALVGDLEQIEGVVSVTSLLSVPLFHSPPVGLLNISEGYKTLADPSVDLELARQELLENPIYSNALISQDARTTALTLRLSDNEELGELEERRYQLRDLQRLGDLTPDSKLDLAAVEKRYKQLNTGHGDRRRQEIERVRQVLDRHRDLGRIELGGVPMIAVDIVDYVERDVVLFGLAVALFVLLVLGLIFRSLKWTVLATSVCATAVLAMAGILGWLDWRTTIVTSNLTSLLFIITMAMAIHVVVRYREVHANSPTSEKSDEERRLSEVVAAVYKPCLFTAITTMVGFGSLYVSNIRPVMDFALMMSLGIVVGFAAVFLLLPALARLWPDGEPPPQHLSNLEHASGLRAIGEFSLRHGRAVIVASALLMVMGAAGAMRLGVENRFMDYFDKSTPIYSGMSFMDRELGGTTPLEIAIELGERDAWLEPENLAQLRRLHDWLESQPEVGKVVSLASMIQILEKIIQTDPNPGMRKGQINKFLLTMIRQRVPPETARLALQPYIDDDYSHTRILARVREADQTLDREDLLDRIDQKLSQTSWMQASQASGPVEPIQARTTGMFLLYNNLLQSLFRSQIQTIVAVFLAIGLTFWLLFRSPRVALVALVPNVLPTALVLGLLGWAGVPLNIMTIMIAAVSLGIAVHDTTHYLHRFKRELEEGHGYVRSVVRCHNSVGRAMLTTTLAITAGFAILCLSNFIPTVQFGLLTGFAMLVALAADLVLLPVLLVKLEPFG